MENGLTRRRPRRRLLLVLGALLAAALAVVQPPARAADGPLPRISLPPDGLRGHALWDSYYDLKSFGYEEQEWFVSGTATDAAGTAPFTTRMIVTRPADPADFNGVVVLDWTNVTAQFENAVDTMEAREMLMREGYAFVHVSAQSAGICCTPLTPKVWDPVRYLALDHPGDTFSFDIFSQVAAAVRGEVAPDSPRAMEGYDVAVVLAAGQSQSGSRLYQYVNAWLPTRPDAVRLIDGFLVHGSAAASKRFDRALPVKVLHLLSDNEAVDDGVDPSTVDPNYRLWEVAGTAHSDFFIGYQSVFGQGPRYVASASKLDRKGYDDLMQAAGNYGEQLHPMLATCVVAGSTMPMRYAASAAIQRLAVWSGGGEAPPNGPRFAFAGGALARDANGNALGGIRLPPIDVPVASYRSTACPLGGLTVPFTDLEIKQRYPTFDGYREQMRARTDAAVLAGWLLFDDAVDLMDRVCAAQTRWHLPTPVACPRYVQPASA